MADDELAAPAGSTSHSSHTRRATTEERLVEAARSLLAASTLDDLTSFVTVKRLTDDSGLSSGAVYSAFTPDAGVGARSRSAPQVAARRSFWNFGSEAIELVDQLTLLFEQVVDASGDDDLHILQSVADLVSGPVAAQARATTNDGWSYTHLFLGAAVALNDPEVGEFLSDLYAGYERAYQPNLEILMRLSGRVLVDGVDLHQFSEMLISATDACALRLRIDPSTDPAIISRMFLAVWIAMTRRADARDDQLGPRLAVRGQGPLDEGQAEAVRAAVLRVFNRAGWPAVTLAKVAQLAGVPDGRLAGVYSSRHDLAVIIRDELVAGLLRRDDQRTALAPGARLEALVEDLSDTVTMQRSVAASLLISQLNRVAESGSDTDDERSLVIIERFAEVIREAAAADGTIDLTAPTVPPAAGDGFRVMARATLELMLLRAAASTMSGRELAALVIDGMEGSGVGAIRSG